MSALPLPTGEATHVFDVIAVLLALQLVSGRDEIWLPERWRTKNLGGQGQQKFLRGLLRMIRFCERFSKPRARWLFAPPFSGLDTLF